MPESKHIRSLKILLHAGFFASGIATVLIGQVLPILTAKFSLDDRQTGNFFPAQFAGSLAGTLLTGWFGRRNRFLTASMTGCLAMAGGILMLNLGSYELCLAGFFLNGFGVGLTLPSINMLILELNPERVTPALNILNFFWGLGAILSQPFVDVLSRGTSIRIPTLVLAGTLFAVGSALSLMPRELEKTPVAGAEADDFDVPIWSNPVAWMIAAFNFIHVGFESGMGGWLKTYTGRIGEGAAAFVPPITLFYIFFVAGRGTAPFFFRYLNDNRMLVSSLLLILVGMAVLLRADSILMLSVGASLAGFGTSSVFPTNMSRFTKYFGPSASRRMTPFFICGTLGAAATTWFIGYVSGSFGNNLHAGMFVLLVSVIILIGVQGVLVTRGKKVTADG